MRRLLPAWRGVRPQIRVQAQLHVWTAIEMSSCGAARMGGSAPFFKIPLQVASAHTRGPKVASAHIRGSKVASAPHTRTQSCKRPHTRIQSCKRPTHADPKLQAPTHADPKLQAPFTRDRLVHTHRCVTKAARVHLQTGCCYAPCREKSAGSGRSSSATPPTPSTLSSPVSRFITLSDTVTRALARTDTGTGPVGTSGMNSTRAQRVPPRLPGTGRSREGAKQTLSAVLICGMHTYIHASIHPVLQTSHGLAHGS
eukprot:360018-Chlamydomonas_euryale.AAC.2